jgi:plastocyanin
MEATMERSQTGFRKPVAALGKLTVATLIGIAVVVVYVMVAMIGTVDPMGLVFSAIPLLFAGIILIGWRWTPLLGVLAGGLLLAFVGPFFFLHLMSTPSEPMFAPILVIVALSIVAVVAGVSATVQNYRYAPVDRRMPRWLPAALVGVVGLVVGAILVATIPPPSTAAGVSPEVLAELPAFTTKDFEFQQKEIRAKAGETVALRLENADPEAHYLNIDELNVNAPIPAGQTSLALFKPTKAGTYTFYCAPHYNKETGEGMKGTLIVE